MWETRIPSVDGEDPLEQGNGNPLQYSLLESSMDKKSPTGLTLTLSLSFIVPVGRWLRQVLEGEELAPVTQLVTRGWEGGEGSRCSPR